MVRVIPPLEEMSRSDKGGAASARGWRALARLRVGLRRAITINRFIIGIQLIQKKGLGSNSQIEF